MHRVALPGAQEGAPTEALDNIRIPFIQRARLTQGGEDRDVFLVDLGLSGVFAEHEPPLPLGEEVRIEFRLPGNEIAILAGCRVAWRHLPEEPPRSLPSGIGLEFVELTDADRARLCEYLAAYCRREGSARRFARHWPPRDSEGGNP